MMTRRVSLWLEVLLTYRSLPTDGLWKNSASDVVLAAPAGDGSIIRWARRIGLMITRIGRRGAVDGFRCAQAATDPRLELQHGEITHSSIAALQHWSVCRQAKTGSLLSSRPLPELVGRDARQARRPLQ